MPLLETKGAASAQGFGGAGASGLVTYIEDVFSTYLYTGNGSTQTITNGIDLSGKGGLVWIKRRDTTQDHALIDTARANGASVGLATNSSSTGSVAAGGFLSTGFSVGNSALTNASNATFASWTFREQPKFFDVVTYTGNGANRTISHNLGSVPGCIIVKRTDVAADWQVYHRSLANTQYLVLNDTAAAATGTTRWNSTTPTSTVFSLGTDTTVNANGGTYVAYLFAHNAGGFGLSGTDNVISCGSYTGTGSAQLINLGYEPQWVLIKQTDAADQWAIIDNMRGWAQSDSATLCANTANAENADFSASGATSLDPQGFRLWNANGALNQSGGTFIYIAIRRGPMKVPTSGTSVYYTTDTNADPAGSNRYVGFPADLQITGIPSGGNHFTYDRLRGVSTTSANGGADLRTNSTNAESTAQAGTRMWGNVYIQVPSYIAGIQAYFWNFRRAPSFFDVVCYTGDSANNRQVTHNLGVSPELIIVKSRTGVDDWIVRWSGNTSNNGRLNTNTSFNQSNYINGQSSTFFQLANNSSQVNNSAFTYVTYLFATCAGVSKVGSYTGTGTTLQVDCGFTGGARFVLIKRTDSTGDWYVWDSARGIVAGSDPYLTLNTTAAEVTTTDWVDTYSAGFELSNAGGNNVNINGATYIFLSVA